MDIQDRANVDLMVDLTATPIRSDSFDAVICVHVLEHVQDDHSAIQEIFCLLKPCGLAVSSVPIRLNQKTFEDTSVTTPEESREALGEMSHVRFYGYDFTERLEVCGFEIQLDVGKEIDLQTMGKYGLKDDENIFFLHKSLTESDSSEQ